MSFSIRSLRIQLQKIALELEEVETKTSMAKDIPDPTLNKLEILVSDIRTQKRK